MAASREATARVRGKTSTARTLVVLGEAALIVALLVAWLVSENIRAGHSLAVLFFYSFPSEFLVGLVPHEPVLLFYGEHHPALTVTAVAGIGTVLAEWMNYSFLSFFNDVGLFESTRRKALAARVIDLFGRAPFLAILVAGFTPIPFFPVRFLVVMEGYPVARYLLGVFISRAPRFFLLAALGDFFRFPGWALLALFAVSIVIIYLPLITRRFPVPSDREAGSTDSRWTGSGGGDGSPEVDRALPASHPGARARKDRFTSP